MNNVLQIRLPGNPEPDFILFTTALIHQVPHSCLGLRTAGSHLVFFVLSDHQKQCRKPLRIKQENYK